MLDGELLTASFVVVVVYVELGWFGGDFGGLEFLFVLLAVGLGGRVYAWECVA